MSFDVLTYRLFRNRRIILLGIAVPVLTVWLAGFLTGSAHPVLMALAIAIPAAHALRYSSVVETLNVSSTLAICLALAALNPEGLAA